MNNAFSQTESFSTIDLEEAWRFNTEERRMMREAEHVQSLCVSIEASTRDDASGVLQADSALSSVPEPDPEEERRRFDRRFRVVIDTNGNRTDGNGNPYRSKFATIGMGKTEG